MKLASLLYKTKQCERYLKNNFLISRNCRGYCFGQLLKNLGLLFHFKIWSRWTWQQCDQIGRFIWATFRSLWQQVVCPNLPHSQAIFVKVSKSLIFLVKSFLGNFYRHLANFYWSHWTWQGLFCSLSLSHVNNIWVNKSSSNVFGKCTTAKIGAQTLIGDFYLSVENISCGGLQASISVSGVQCRKEERNRVTRWAYYYPIFRHLQQ